MKIYKSIIMSLLTLLISCKTKNDPIKTITSLKNVSKIEVIRLKPERVEFSLNQERDISNFLSTFQPAKTSSINNASLSESEFNKDGEIIIKFSNKPDSVVINLDFDVGYCVEIRSKKYYNFFTYRTGRYLAEKIYESQR